MYVPSAADAPDGPRNNRDELDEIAKRTAEFENRENDFAEGEREVPEPVEIGDSIQEIGEDTIDIDPFSPEFSPKLSLIVLMRLYDVQMAILNEMNETMAARINEIHEHGGIVGSLPWLDLRE